MPFDAARKTSAVLPNYAHPPVVEVALALRFATPLMATAFNLERLLAPANPSPLPAPG